VRLTNTEQDLVHECMRKKKKGKEIWRWSFSNFMWMRHNQLERKAAEDKAIKACCDNKD
jgi:hypothetical protein